jgi:hypothetical protein
MQLGAGLTLFTLVAGCDNQSKVEEAYEKCMRSVPAEEPAPTVVTGGNIGQTGARSEAAREAITLKRIACKELKTRCSESYYGLACQESLMHQ